MHPLDPPPLFPFSPIGLMYDFLEFKGFYPKNALTIRAPFEWSNHPTVRGLIEQSNHPIGPCIVPMVFLAEC